MKYTRYYVFITISDKQQSELEMLKYLDSIQKFCNNKMFGFDRAHVECSKIWNL